ncbi:MAG: hypothetical protein BRD48_02360 [Bacteroidetes bacterium QS_9_68_14]|nr:MAG: hypothetical protein BRD48_02360 [Bacteroidetes bacterium QS_9_68_14]
MGAEWERGRALGKRKCCEATHAMNSPRPLSAFPALLPALALFIGACGSPFAEAPPVADSTLVSALAELHLAEARLRSGAPEAPDTMRVALPPGVRDSILARHDMRYRSFRAALDYYVRHPEQYTKLYARVVDTLRAGQEARSSGGSDDARVAPEAFRNPRGGD